MLSSCFLHHCVATSLRLLESIKEPKTKQFFLLLLKRELYINTDSVITLTMTMFIEYSARILSIV